MTTLFARLSLAFTAILLILGLSVLWLSHRSSQEYFLEFTQEINAPIAMYMAQNGGFIAGEVLDPLWLTKLAPHVMMINPSVEVYMLDKKGIVVGSSFSSEELQRTHINLQPVRDFLQPDRVLPIKGDDPRHNTNQRIFSAFPLFAENLATGEKEVSGYVYAVIAGEHYQSAFDLVRSSYSFKNLIVTLSFALLLALLSGVMVFMMLTRRLRYLTTKVSKKAFTLTRSSVQSKSNSRAKARLDEIDQLTYSYQSMANELVHQYKELEGNESNRREFIANISHDLRTPLTTMQSYLETLLLKDCALSKEEKHNCLRIAYRQTRHLKNLVEQLFTITKLESGEVAPSLEKFSLLELAHDTAQEFQEKARLRGVNLSVQPENDIGGKYDVVADIGMIHRVFGNLVANALRHTSEKGDVLIYLKRSHKNHVDIAFIDTGCGMTQEQCRKIMRRYYTSSVGSDGIGGPSGLGMAIVKNILALHDASMKIDSVPGQGTTIRFTLATSRQTIAPAKAAADRELSVV